MIEMFIALIAVAVIGTGTEIYQEAQDRSLEREYTRQRIIHMGDAGTGDRANRYCKDGADTDVGCGDSPCHRDGRDKD